MIVLQEMVCGAPTHEKKIEQGRNQFYSFYKVQKKHEAKCSVKLLAGKYHVNKKRTETGLHGTCILQVEKIANGSKLNLST